MVEPTARLVEHVFPRVPVNQWVVSFPWPLCLLFVARPDLLSRVLGLWNPIGHRCSLSWTL